MTDHRAAAAREVPLATVTDLSSRLRARRQEVGLATVTPISGRSWATVVPLHGGRGRDRSSIPRQLGTISVAAARRDPDPPVRPRALRPVRG